MTKTLHIAAANTRTAEQIEIARLKAELDHFTKSSIIEIAVRNPSVMEYMKHWEERATNAEAENERLREALNYEPNYSELDKTWAPSQVTAGAGSTHCYQLRNFLLKIREIAKTRKVIGGKG